MNELDKIFRTLTEFLRRENCIMQSRVNVKALRELCESGRAYLKIEDSSPVAFAALWPSLSDRFLELGTVWVNPSHRGTGLANIAFEKCNLLAPENFMLYLITRKREIEEVAKKHGWYEHAWYKNLKREGKTYDWSRDELWKDVIPPWGRSEKSNPGKLMLSPRDSPEYRVY